MSASQLPHAYTAFKIHSWKGHCGASDARAKPPPLPKAGIHKPSIGIHRRVGDKRLEGWVAACDCTHTQNAFRVAH